MKKIYCNINLFTIEQKVYIIDTETGESVCVATTEVEQLPEVISALSNEKGIFDIHLDGGPAYGATVAQDIATFAKSFYSHNELNITY